MNERTDVILASIDGALADLEIPDGMRWSPEPEAVKDAPAPYDGSLVWQPPQRYEDAGEEEIVRESHAQRLLERLSPQEFPRVTAERGGLRFYRDEEPRPFLSGQCAALAHDECRHGPRCLCTCHDLAGAIRRTAGIVPPSAEELAEAARAWPPAPQTIRVSDHNPIRIVAIDRDDDTVRVVFALDTERLARAWADALRGVERVFAEIGPALQRATRQIADALNLPAPIPSREEPRARALAYRRSLSTGPAMLGPEQSRRPRRHL